MSLTKAHLSISLVASIVDTANLLSSFKLEIVHTMRQPNHALSVDRTEAIYLHESSNTHSRLAQSLWMRCGALRCQTIDWKRCLCAREGRASSRPAKIHRRKVDALSVCNILRNSVENDEGDSLTIQSTNMTTSQQHRCQCTGCF